MVFVIRGVDEGSMANSVGKNEVGLHSGLSSPPRKRGSRAASPAFARGRLWLEQEATAGDLPSPGFPLSWERRLAAVPVENSRFIFGQLLVENSRFIFGQLLRVSGRQKQRITAQIRCYGWLFFAVIPPLRLPKTQHFRGSG